MQKNRFNNVSVSIEVYITGYLDTGSIRLIFFNINGCNILEQIIADNSLKCYKERFVG